MSERGKVTRRDMLRNAGVVGAAAAVPGLLPIATVTAQAIPYKQLTAAEGKLLEAIVDRLIPADTSGPGALEAGVVRYIDGALADALSTSRAAYTAGLAALDRYANATRGKPFADLAPRDQDSVLIDCETGAATGFTGSSAQFFGMLLNHTRQGMFGDPHYGGNQNFVGWDLLGYPGVRVGVSAADQSALEAGKLAPVRRSAYDYGGFHQDSDETTHGR